jgi:hypothetical protein
MKVSWSGSFPMMKVTIWEGALLKLEISLIVTFNAAYEKSGSLIFFSGFDVSLISAILAFVSRSWSCRSFSSSLSRSRSLQLLREAMVATMDYGKAAYK